MHTRFYAQLSYLKDLQKINKKKWLTQQAQYTVMPIKKILEMHENSRLT